MPKITEATRGRRKLWPNVRYADTLAKGFGFISYILQKWWSGQFAADRDIVRTKFTDLDAEHVLDIDCCRQNGFICHQDVKLVAKIIHLQYLSLTYKVTYILFQGWTQYLWNKSFGDFCCGWNFGVFLTSGLFSTIWDSKSECRCYFRSLSHFRLLPVHFRRNFC